MRNRRIPSDRLTGQGDVRLVLACVSPLEHSKRLTDREGTGGILECDNAVPVRDELSNIRVLFELKLRAVGRRRRGKCKLDAA